MENKSNAGSDAKVGSECAKPNLTNHHEDPNYVHVEEQEQEVEVGGSGIEQAPQPPRQPPRTPFTNLSQVEADLALARTLQEQERAFMMLQMNNEGSDYGSWEGGSYAYDDEDDFDDPHEDTDEDDEEGYDGTNLDDDEDAFDVHAHDMAEEENDPRVEFDPAVFLSDEVYARALQDAEDIEMAARLFVLAGLNDREADIEDHGGYSLTTEVEEDTWEEVDPDELSYEELIALGEVVGTESRGLSADTIASLPSVNYKSGSNQNGNNDSCVICRLDYEDGETLTVLSCKHSYHSECISDWLKINKMIVRPPLSCVCEESLENDGSDREKQSFAIRKIYSVIAPEVVLNLKKVSEGEVVTSASSACQLKEEIQFIECRGYLLLLS